MLIANPIYDVVFEYLMDDSKIAKLMISSIIDENIEKLTFLPQEFISEIDKTNNRENTKTKRTKKISRTVYRLGFSAKIKTADGYKSVIIELQKAKFPTDIMRYRKCPGEQFSNKENIQKIKIGNRISKTGLPIISIYFLGHKLDHTTSSAIKVSRQYRDLITNQIIDTKEAFIESLTLDSYVIQIPYLTDKRRTELEILLSVFDQSNPADKEHHILNVKEEDFPEKYRPIIRKLQKAILDIDIRKKMELQDGIIDELEDIEREIGDLEQKLDTAEQKLDTAEQQFDTVEQESDHVKQETDQVKLETDQVKQKLNSTKQKLDTAEKEKEALRIEVENLRKTMPARKSPGS